MGLSSEILEWSKKRPAWQQDALRRLFANGPLDSDAKRDLLKMIEASAGDASAARAYTPLSEADLPAEVSSGANTTRLVALHSVTNVGRLAPNVRLDFQVDGLTAIYGDNGAGKSGYTRVLRRACRSRGDDGRKAILSDVFMPQPEVPASAVLELTCAGTPVTYTWQDGSGLGRREDIVVFDSDASVAYVEAGHAIELLPLGLDRLQALIEFCTEAHSSFEARLTPLKKQTQTAAVTVQAGTAAHKFIAALSANTSDEELAKAISFSDAERARLAELSLTVVAPEQRRKALNLLKFPTQQLPQAVEAAEDWLSDEALAALKEAFTLASRTKEEASQITRHLLEGHDVPVGSSAWKSMFEAAVRYSKEDLGGGETFPGSNPLCPLCQQNLSAEAHERLTRLYAYIADDAAVSAAKAQQRAEQCLAELDAATTEALQQARKAALAEEAPEILSSVTLWAAATEQRARAVKDWLRDHADLPPCASKVSDELWALLHRWTTDLAALSTDKESPEWISLISEHNELSARKTLAESTDQIRERISLLRQIQILEGCCKLTHTQSVTKEFNRLKNIYLSDRLVEAFTAEAKSLGLTRLKTELRPKSDRKAACFTVGLAGASRGKLMDILSEGERRALSLALFFAEQNISDAVGCLIFDDPVSSLDHKWTVSIAKRIVEEAQRRQVIVFTHDLIFYKELCSAADEAGCQAKHKTLFHAPGGRAGQLDPFPGGNWKAQAVTKRLGILDTMLQNARNAARESSGEYELQAKALYGRMRDTWERLVEELLLGGVIQRFKKQVRTTNLKYLTAEPDILARINAGMTRTSNFSHDNASANSDPIPEPDEIAADLEELRAVAYHLASHKKSIDNKK